MSYSTAVPFDGDWLKLVGLLCRSVSSIGAIERTGGLSAGTQQ
jgi:hypothetical protein